MICLIVKMAAYTHDNNYQMRANFYFHKDRNSVIDLEIGDFAIQIEKKTICIK